MKTKLLLKILLHLIYDSNDIERFIKTLQPQGNDPICKT